MCPTGKALDHPTANLLSDYATCGCPTDTGSEWIIQDIKAAIVVVPHVSALVPKAMKQLQNEVTDKVKKSQAWVVLWKNVKKKPPEKLKILRIAMIPHKSRKLCHTQPLLSYPIEGTSHQVCH